MYNIQTKNTSLKNENRQRLNNLKFKTIFQHVSSTCEHI